MINRRGLTMLNKGSEYTLTWTPDRDDDMEVLIGNKMRRGCIILIIAARLPPIPATGLSMVRTPEVPARILAVAKTAREAAQHECIAIAPDGARRGKPNQTRITS